MNQNILQDVQQIRTICQQLAQNERQNAQHLSSQGNGQFLAQRENVAAQQLQHCVDLCNRVEQTVQTTSFSNQSLGYGTGVTSAHGYGYNSSVTSTNAGVQTTMQADQNVRNYRSAPGTYGTQTTSNYGSSYASGRQTGYSNFNTTSYNTVANVDNFNTASRGYPGTSVVSGSFRGYGQPNQGVNPAIQQAMQADRGFTRTNTTF